MRKFKINLTVGCGIFISLYIVLMVLFYFLIGEQLYWRDSSNGNISVAGEIATEEVEAGDIIEQRFVSNMSRIQKFSIRFTTFARKNSGNIQVRLYDETNQDELLSEKTLDVTNMLDGEYVAFDVDENQREVYGHHLRIVITTDEAIKGNAIAPWYNSKTFEKDQKLFINGKEVDGTLCFTTQGQDKIWTGFHYWQIVTCIGVVLILYCILLIWKSRTNQKSIGLTIINMSKKYKFLMKQLVSRDFKIKYKRSVLGAFWSFLNPLLTMCVQYVVFSTIFKSDIKNYPVYLLSGIVLFNFFQEATGASLSAIVGNSSLITKVYVPKYIYPISKVLSSSINLVISMLPLLIVALVTQVEFTKAFFLLPYILICLIMFCVGLAFILSAAMVFFRDVQFIWSVLSMIWMYCTPIFYPENILPSWFQNIHRINPMYCFIKFFRTIIIEGISPEPIFYIKGIMFAFVFMLIGSLIFKKTQDKFVFYI